MAKKGNNRGKLPASDGRGEGNPPPPGDERMRRMFDEDPPDPPEDFKKRIETRLAAYDPVAGAVNLSTCRINDSSVAWVLKSLGTLKNLTTLDLGRNLIGPAGAKDIAASDTLGNLTTLHVESNLIGDAGAKVIAASTALKNLTTLDLGSNGIGPAGAKVIAASTALKNLTTLDLGHNSIGAAGAKDIAASKTLGNLTTLHLESNLIGDAGAKDIAASTTLKNLTTLNLGNSLIGTAGAKDIADSATLKNLTTLNLVNNFIGAAGTKDIADSNTLKNLTTLHLRYNSIGPAGAKDIAASTTLKNLATLNLEGNSIGEAGGKDIAASTILKNLTTLDLRYNSISPGGAKDIAASTTLKNLMTLNLMRNSICDAGAKDIAASTILKNLTTLDLRDNLIGDAGCVTKLLKRFTKLIEVLVDDNPLRWSGMEEGIPREVLAIRDPVQLLARLDELKDKENRSQLWIARGVLGGPTEHGKTHLSRWITYPKERHGELKKQQDRGKDGDGTWGADITYTTLTADEHAQPQLQDIHLHVIDTGGHPQQLLSHANLYFATWSRTVFIICYRCDEPFEGGMPEYHFGLLSDLKARSISARRGEKYTVENLAEEERLSFSPNDPELQKLRVVLVGTHADRAKAAGVEPAGPDDQWLAARFPLLEIVNIRAWDALTGTDVAEIKRSIGVQLAKLPELRKPLPKYIEALWHAVDERFKADSAEPDAPRCWSMSWEEYVGLCVTHEIEDEAGRHLWALRVLDNLGHVVAPRCHEEPPPVGMRILNPAFIQRYLYNRLLNPKPRPAGGVVSVPAYRKLTQGLDEQDRRTLEWLMETCLVAFKVDVGLPEPAWLIPDLLSPATFAPWPHAHCSAGLRVGHFLNEATFFDFVKRHLSNVERTKDENSDQARLSVYRNGCVLKAGDFRARVQFDVFDRRIDIEVVGGSKEGAIEWCGELKHYFQRDVKATGVVKEGHGKRKRGNQLADDPANSERIQGLLKKWLAFIDERGTGKGMMNTFWRENAVSDEDQRSLSKAYDRYRAKRSKSNDESPPRE